MLVRIFFFLLGYALTVIGFIYIISYMNLMAIGYNFLEYANFIFRRLECLYAFLGMIILFLSITLPLGGNYELHI